MDRLLFPSRDARAFDADPPAADPRALHRTLPGYAPTPLREAPRLAARLGLARLWVKDESARLGLPAFKILGASWASWCALAERIGLDPANTPDPLGALRARAGALRGLRLAAATDGNHGRGVARVACWLGLPARIFVPAGTARSRIDAIAGEGAEVIEVEGHYDDTVARAAAEQERGAILVQDHAWPGYEDVPGRVVEGYATIFAEIDEQLGAGAPRLALIQTGVGALAAAAVRHWRRPGLPRPQRPALANVEPTGAACVLESVAAGRIVTVPAGAHSSLMAGLNCGTPSSVAWPAMQQGMDAFVAVPDERAVAAMRALADDGIVSGESGAAGVAGLLALCDDSAARTRLGLDRDAEVLAISTEGATDPASWERWVGRRLPER
jgi:diaminopropionate ammonia-lyase